MSAPQALATKWGFPLLLLAVAACDAQAGAPHDAAQVAAAAAARPLPRLTGRVMDDANVLSPAVEASLVQQLQALEKATTDQVVVVSVPNLEGERIEDLGLRLGNGWGIGRKGLDNGVLLIVAVAEKRARIEVAAGLEGLLTNERAAQIMSDHVVAHCGASRFELGVTEGVDAIERVLRSDARRPQRSART